MQENNHGGHIKYCCSYDTHNTSSKQLEDINIKRNTYKVQQYGLLEKIRILKELFNNNLRVLESDLEIYTCKICLLDLAEKDLEDSLSQASVSMNKNWESHLDYIDARGDQLKIRNENSGLYKDLVDMLFAKDDSKGLIEFVRDFAKCRENSFFGKLLKVIWNLYPRVMLESESSTNNLYSASKPISPIVTTEVYHSNPSKSISTVDLPTCAEVGDYEIPHSEFFDQRSKTDIGGSKVCLSPLSIQIPKVSPVWVSEIDGSLFNKDTFDSRKNFFEGIIKIQSQN